MCIENVLALALKLGFRCYENEPLKNRTTFKIGGPAEWLVECDDVSRIDLFLKAVKESSLPLTVIGKGSNLLVSDSGVKGIVLVITDGSVTVDRDTVTASAGAKLSKACNAALEAELSGLEFGYGIPGSVGGAVYMNAGAYGGEISQVLAKVTAVTRDGDIKTYSADELQLGYRTSIFKQNKEIILSAEFRLLKSNFDAVKGLMDDYLSRRRAKQPLEYPSAGSTFKRPEGYFAGALIEQSGLKGFSVGDAEVSRKHAGFVINKGNASAADVLNLIKHIRSVVLEKHGVELEPEVIFVE